MIIHKQMILQLTDAEIKELKVHSLKLMQHLGKGFPLKVNVLEDLRAVLTRIVNQSQEWQDILKSIHDSGDYYCIHLLHSDNEILNLPWSIAVDNISGQPLGSIQQLYLTKSIPQHFQEKSKDFTKAAPPLKILIMVSSPEDPEDQVKESWKKRLSYEEEEFEILKAFEPLMQTGQVEIDFTEDGSLESLERKLIVNEYHILHFYGNAIYSEKDNTGYLQLENPRNLRTDRVTARDFVDTVNCKPDYKVPMVVLSSCQTAKGSSEKGLRGVTNHLLRIGVPVVVSMGMSIYDTYAAQFSAHFYNQVARRQTIFSAFNQAIEHIRKTEYNHLLKTHVIPVVPLQWIIPNLYLSRELDRLVDWDQPREKLELYTNRYIFEKDLLLLKHEREYLFIGRRKEKAEILRPLFEKKPVLLKGQGGVGKTAMAEHLVQRLIAANPKTIPFVFNEKIKSIKEILEMLQNFLMEQGYVRVISEINQYEKGMDKFLYLVFTITQECKYQPLFVFDNLDSFQSEPGETLSEEFRDIKEVIDFLCESGKAYVILTCRYPVRDIKNLHTFDLNQVGFNDFWKKCLYMDVGDIHIHLREKAYFEKSQEGFLARPGLQYIDVVKLLHNTFGGNYRALEFFDRMVKVNPDKIISSLDSLEKFRESSKTAADEIKYQMGQNLLFSQLMSLLLPDQKCFLELLSHFRIPVQQLALRLQIQNQPDFYQIDFKPILASLNRLTLIDISLDPETQMFYYYVTPIVKNLLAVSEKNKTPYLFSHQQAGIYYYHSFYNISDNLTSLEEAFYHFNQSENKEKVQEIGDRLSRFYYGYSLFHKAFFYAHQVYQLLSDETKITILNYLGLINDLYGDYDNALSFFEKALEKYRRSKDRKGEASVLNNIGGIYHSRGDYETALKYLEESFKIRQEIGDKAGEGKTLNNISQVYYARGDYETALKYLEESSKISMEIGDKSSEASILHNIGNIFQSRGDYETALQYYERTLKIRQEIGIKAGEGSTLNNISQIYSARGDYDTALKYLEQSLRISQQIGDKSGEGTNLNNISQIYYDRGDYDTALKYLEQSLRISQQIGDKSGEGTKLNNISQVYYAHGDYETALKYLEESLKISMEIGDKSSEASILHNIGNIFQSRGDYETALQYYERTLKIRQEIGDKAGEVSTLSNISQIYSARGVYDTALKYLEQSLRISQQIGDKSGEGTNLNNISQIYYDRGDYDTALKYLEQSLRIRREIGREFGEGALLKNISKIFAERKDLETALLSLDDRHQFLKTINESFKIRLDNNLSIEDLVDAMDIIFNFYREYSTNESFDALLGVYIEICKKKKNERPLWNYVVL